MRHTARRCPVCNTMCRIHCRTIACRWFVCPREACRAVIDYVAGIGFMTLPGNEFRRFTFPATT